MEAVKSKHPRWVYLLPVLHLSACLISMVGHVIPSLQSLGIIWVGITLVDLPVSAPAYVLAWWNGPLTVIWIVVAGTLWWYFVSRVIERLIKKNRMKASSVPTAEKC
jgi:hypothetical protein